MTDTGLQRRRIAGTFALAAWLSLTIVVQAEPERHCLWRVQSERQTLYLQGSVHLLKESDYPLPEALQHAFTNADALVLEIDLGVAEDPDTQITLLSKGLLTGKATLRDVITPRTYKLVAGCLTELGADISAFARFKPWFLILAMTEIKLRKLGFDSTLGLDWHFYREAKRAGKAIRGLETLEYQLSLFDGLGDMDQDALVRQTLQDFDTIEAELGRIVTAWRNGDLATLEATLLASFKEYPDLYATLITKRNKAWLTTLEQLLRGDQTVMVVVGAGHLPGPDGLLEQLKKKGYAVEQL